MKAIAACGNSSELSDIFARAAYANGHRIEMNFQLMITRNQQDFCKRTGVEPGCFLVS
ncbi:hypothetical protein KP509_37G035100 [Ceratopteris richardii]|uniref:Uncharacterized protein n=1 Tax=Ceratopteris richardii TaxID=49495 RepID=A0A8T2Q7Z8_CERRI|nr:hypothetical protein KP509_37G035100 [Ceratopteris richardii]